MTSTDGIDVRFNSVLSLVGGQKSWRGSYPSGTGCMGVGDRGIVVNSAN